MDLLNNPIVEIALSLIVTWALFAIMCSFAFELIAEAFSVRGRFLRKKLRDQLADRANGINWASPVYLHGSVDLLSRAENRPSSLIPSKLFGEVLVEVVGNAHMVQHRINNPPADSDQSPEAVNHRNFLTAYGAIPYGNIVLKNFKAATLALASSDVVSFYKQALNSAELRAGVAAPAGVPAPDHEAKVYNNLIENICNWYDSFSGRINVWYKKITRERLLYVGFVFAALFHVDTIQLFKYFRDQPEARRGVISYFEQNIDQLEKTYITDKDKKDSTELVALQKKFRTQMDSVKTSLKLPIGWKYASIDKKENGWWAWKILGLALTALAGSFGAPFWFDIFKKITKNKIINR